MYQAVTIPNMTYTADIWYTPVQEVTAKNGKVRQVGSIGITKQLDKVQRIALLNITRALRTTPTDSLEVHANIPPMEIAMDNIYHQAAARLSTLLTSHPLWDQIFAAATDTYYVKSANRSPLYKLAALYHINLHSTETIHKSTRRYPQNPT